MNAAVLFPTLSWFVLSVCVGVVAADRGRSGPGWTCLSLLLSPLAGAFLVCALRPLLRHDEQTCPACFEFVKREAAVCRHCDFTFKPRPAGRTWETTGSELRASSGVATAAALLPRFSGDRPKTDEPA